MLTIVCSIGIAMNISHEHQVWHYMQDVSPLYYVEGSGPFLETEGHATALHFAVQHDNMDMVSSLLSEGANINAPAHHVRHQL